MTPNKVLDRICEEVQQNMANKSNQSSQNIDEINWDVSVEILLFYAMKGRKPVGVNRNFMMLSIHDRFSNYVKKEMHSKPIWEHLDSMYDMAALHESEIIPFPNDEVEYELPKEFDDIIMNKFGVVLSRSKTEERENLKNSSSAKSSKRLSSSKLKQGNVNTKNTSTPSGNKTKNTSSTKNDIKSSVEANNSKPKDLLFPLKTSNKVRRSSSPFSIKSTKSETNSHSKESSPDIPLIKKALKLERSNSPATNARKSTKNETSSTSYSSKKVKQENVSNSLKPPKSETNENSARKAKHERETGSKKNKANSSSEWNSKKNVKAENHETSRKHKNESENKKSDSSNKHSKSESKNYSNKGQKDEDYHPGSRKGLFLGSRKSTPSSKVEANENQKKRKRQKVDESLKKPLSSTKRRRTQTS